MENVSHGQIIGIDKSRDGLDIHCRRRLVLRYVLFISACALAATVMYVLRGLTLGAVCIQGIPICREVLFKIENGSALEQTEADRRAMGADQGGPARTRWAARAVLTIGCLWMHGCGWRGRPRLGAICHPRSASLGPHRRGSADRRWWGECLFNERGAEPDLEYILIDSTIWQGPCGYDSQKGGFCSRERVFTWRSDDQVPCRSRSAGAPAAADPGRRAARRLPAGHGADLRGRGRLPRHRRCGLRRRGFGREDRRRPWGQGPDPDQPVPRDRASR